MNLSKVIAKRPFLLLRSAEDIDKDALAVSGGRCQVTNSIPPMQVSFIRSPPSRCPFIHSEVIHRRPTHATCQVKKLFARAKNVDLLMESVPELLNPKAALSVLVTVNKW